MAGKSGAEVGLQAGAAFGPWGAAIGAGVGAASDLIGKEMGGPVASSAQVDARSWMDGSGWTVSTGSSRATGGRFGGNTQEGQRGGAQAPASASYAPAQMPYGMGAALDGTMPGDFMSATIGGFPVLGLLAIGAAFLLAKA